MNAPLNILRPIPLPAGPFDVILADPPWRFRTWSPLGEGKSPPYAKMSLDQMKALPVASIAAPDCFLVLWGTAPMLPEAFALMASWGFTFKSMGAWAKRSKANNSWAFGTGYLLRSAAEPYLIGTRGKPKSAVRDVRNLIVAPVREHSRKPDELYVDLERMFPQARRLEMFARGVARRSWITWGLEAIQPERIER